MTAESMLAVVTHGPKDYRIEEIPVPQPELGHLPIEMAAIGLAIDTMAPAGARLFRLL
jgi:erythritol/L-threitol dehydrogenase